MILRAVGRTLLALLLLMFAYLSTVAVWASVSLDDVLSKASMISTAVPLSQRQTDILLRIEDPTFVTHSGLSLAKGQGLTTITSTVAKEMFLSGADLDGLKGGFQAFYRRVFDCCKKIDFGRDVMALVLNARLSKQQQLAIYVAHIYMGTSKGIQVKGLGQAAASYFGKPLDRIPEHEFAALVAMIKAPNQFHPVRNPAAYALRAGRVDAVISGRCEPAGWLDTSYQHCAR